MPTRGGRLFGRLADAFIPGNAYNSTTGRWNPATTKTGIAGLIADQFVPGGSNLVGMAGRGGLFGGEFANQLKNEGIYNTLADQYGDFRSDLADQYLHPQVDIGGGFGGNPQVSVGHPQTVSMGGYAPSIPTMPQVDTQAPWQGLGTGTGNTLSGGALGNWANGGGAPQGLHYGNGSGAGTGYGASNYQNDQWGQTALGFGLGTGFGSAGSFALADAQKAAKINRV